ncbi:hypothetical protein [Pseudoxanthomonas sp. 10H]|uniref:hypothetical protein n=1 Tax=Pseudoxanthomonas sp. 10H TaxID=3242729 RepID=UPI0035581270
MLGTQVLRAFVLGAAVAGLAACAGAQHKAARAVPAKQPVAAKKGPHGYRFDMTQHGKKMSADDFEAWMKANGLHVAKGKGAPGGDGKASAKAKPKPRPAKKVAAAAAPAPKPSRD